MTRNILKFPDDKLGFKVLVDKKNNMVLKEITVFN
jgi:hypothetical protein